MAATVQVRVLGPAELVIGGTPISLRRRERAVLAALALAGRPLTVAEVAGRLWLEPPPSAAKSVHNHIRRLRASGGRAVVETTLAGYRLAPGVVRDLDEVDRHLERAEAAAAAGDHDHAAAELHEALRLWRGTPFAELAPTPGVVAARRRWEERLGALAVERASRMMRAGNFGAAAAELQDLVELEPHREHRWSLLARALYRSGRRRDSLRVLARARQAMVSVGLDLSPDLLELEQRILVDDPRLVGEDHVERRRRTASEAPSGTSTFVGRVALLDHLAMTWADVSEQRRARLVVVEGEPGVGKTALVRRASAHAAARGAVVAWGSCDPTPVAPLAPFAAVLAELVDVHGRPVIDGWAGDLAPAVAVVLDGGQVTDAPVRLADAVVTVLTEAARHRPTLVALDDVHWALPTTLRVVDRCRSAQVPLLVIGTRRPGSGQVHPGDVLLVGGLELDEVRALVAAHLERQASDELVRALGGRTGGNPLYVKQLLADLDPLATDAELLDQVSSAVPGAVVETVRRQFGELSARTRRVVAAAAVLGQPDPALLDAMVGPCGRELDEAVTSGLLSQTADGLAFTHAIHREAAEAGVPEGLRLELHDSAGRALAAGRPGALTAIAHHHLEAAVLDPTAAYEAALAAGRAAAAAHAHGEAASLLGSALDLVPPADRERADHLAIRVELGESLRLAGDPRSREVLVAAAERAAAVGDDHHLGLAALSLCRLGSTSEAGAVDEVIRDLAERALARVRDDALRAELAAAMSLLLSLDGDPERCRSLFLGAETAARTADDPGVLVRVLPYAYLALGRHEDAVRRADLADELVRCGEGLRDDIALFEGLHLRFSARVQLARSGAAGDLARMSEIAARHDDVGQAWAVGYLSSTLAHLQGRLEEADAINEATFAAAGGIATSRALAVYGGQLLALRTDQGRSAELIPILEPLMQDQPGVPGWVAAYAGAAASAGDGAAARRAFDQLAPDGFGALPDDFIRSGALLQLVRAMLALDDLDRAHVAAQALLPWSGRFTWVGTSTFGPADQVIGEVAARRGDRTTARRHFALAARRARRVGAPTMAERADRSLGELG